MIVQEQIKLVTEECCNCGIVFAIPHSLHRKMKEQGGTFYCPNGHGQHYTKSDNQKLREQIDRLKNEKKESDEWWSNIYDEVAESIRRKMTLRPQKPQGPE